MLYGAEVAVCSEMNTKHINTVGAEYQFLSFNPKATNVIYIYMEHPFLIFLDHTQRRSTVGRTPLDE